MSVIEPPEQQPDLAADLTSTTRMSGDFVAMLAGRAAVVVTAPLTVIISTSILGAAGFGRLNLLLIVPGLIVQIAAQWSSAAPLVLGREELQDHGTLGRTTWSRFALIAPLLLLGVAVILLGRPLLGLYAGFGWGLIVLALLQAPISIVGEHVVALLQAAGRMRASALVEAVQRVIVIVGLVIVLIIGTDELSAVLGVFVITATIGTTYAVSRIGRIAFVPFRVERTAVQTMLAFSLPLVLTTLSGFFVRWCDVVIINAYRTLEEVGQYAVSYQGYMALYSFTVIALSLLTPLITSLRSAGRSALVARYVERGIVHGALVTAVLIGLGTPLIHLALPALLGSEFEPSADALALLLLSLQGVMVISLAVPVMLAYRLTRTLAIIGVATAVANIALDLVLVPAIGIEGAAIATVIAQTAPAIAILVVAARAVDARTPLWWVASLPAVVGVLGVVLMSGELRYAIPPAAALGLGIVLARTTGIVRPDDVGLYQQIGLPPRIRRAMERFVGWAAPA